MLEERLTKYWTLVSRYRKTLTQTTKDVVIEELKEHYNSTSSQRTRTAITTFLASVGAYGATGSTH